MKKTADSVDPTDWLKSAYADMKVVESIRGDTDRYVQGLLVYHLQQASEKSIKSVVLHIDYIYPFAKNKAESIGYSLASLGLLLPDNFVKWFQELLTFASRIKELYHDPIEKLLVREELKDIISRFKEKANFIKQKDAPHVDFKLGPAEELYLKGFTEYLSILNIALNKKRKNMFEDIADRTENALSVIRKTSENRDMYLKESYHNYSENLSHPERLKGYDPLYKASYDKLKDFGRGELKLSGGTGKTEATVWGYDLLFKVQEFFAFFPIIAFLTPFAISGRYPKKNLQGVSIFDNMPRAINAIYSLLEKTEALLKIRPRDFDDNAHD